jgi:hypothetical protein
LLLLLSSALNKYNVLSLLLQKGTATGRSGVVGEGIFHLDPWIGCPRRSW